MLQGSQSYFDQNFEKTEEEQAQNAQQAQSENNNFKKPEVAADLTQVGGGEDVNTYGGLAVYLSETMLQKGFEKIMKPLIATEYHHVIESGETNSVAGVIIGVRKVDVTTFIRLHDYNLSFDNEGRIKFTLRNEHVQGKIVLHVEKAAKFIWNLGDLHNKDYHIDFNLTINNITSAVKLSADKDGVPQIRLEIDAGDFDFADDLRYNITNPDLLTSLVDHSKKLWVKVLNKQFKTTILPQVNEMISETVNEQLKALYPTHFDVDGELNFRVNTRCEAFSLHQGFLRLLVNGMIINKVTKLDQSFKDKNLPTGDMPDLTSKCDVNFVYVQVADWVLQFAVKAYFLNKLEFKVPIEYMTLKGMVVKHLPDYEIKLNLLRDPHPDAEELRKLTVLPMSDFNIILAQRFLPDFHFGVRGAVKVSEVDLLKKKAKETDEEEKLFVKFKVSEMQAMNLYNSEMKPIDSFHSDFTGMIGYARDYLHNMVLDQEIALDEIKVADYCTVEPSRFLAFDKFLLLKFGIKF